MCIIGRLSNLNPAFVMPTLRKVLIQISTELEYSGIGRNKEQSAKLLGHLISNAPKLVRPYQKFILKVGYKEIYLCENLFPHIPPPALPSLLLTFSEPLPLTLAIANILFEDVAECSNEKIKGFHFLPAFGSPATFGSSKR